MDGSFRSVVLIKEVEMRKSVLVTTTVLVLACGAIAASAQAPGAQPPGTQQIQPVPGGPMMQQDQTRLQRRAQAGEDEDSDQDGFFRFHRGMMGRGLMGGGMIGRGYGRGIMGPMMMRMIFSLMDADGDGKISLQEFQAAHVASSRRWMPTKMAMLPLRKCRISFAVLAGKHLASRILN